MNCPTNKKKGVSCTKTMRFHPFVSTGNAPRKGTRGVPAELDEAIPLNKIKYNEQRDKETGFGHIGPLGGRYQNYYKYDPLHRLTRAGGSDQYGFEQAFELSRAGRPLSMSTNGKVKHYAYGEHTPPHAPQRIMVEEGFRHTLHDLRWDPAGNLGQVSTLAHDRGDIQSRFLFWTEDSRLHTVVDDRHHSYYAYDHAGERAMKVTGHSHQLDVNADLMHTVAGLDEFTLYPSPYLVFTNRGYTKHYYAGSERLAARLGGGFDRPILREQTDIAMTATHLFKQSQHHTNERHLNAPPAHTIRRDHLSENIYRAITKEFEAPMHLVTDAVIKSNNLLSTAQNIVSDNTEPDVYFYHSDHLGSASWITDGDGIPIQHLQYLPYGEPFVNQRAAGSTYSERFRFTGKERDEETGYGYFGARYMDHELMTMWLSVDPLADKYPSLSPYNYCMWNPIKVVDPNGMDTSICYTQTSDNQETMNYARRHYSYNRPDLLHYCAHGTTNNMYPFGYEEKPNETANSMHNHVKDGGTKYNIIVLHSCDVGKGKGCFAEVLSNQLPDVLIFAPSDKLAVSDKYDKEYVMNNGSWNVYYGGKLVNTCPGSHEDTKALQFIWKNIPTQEIIEQFTQPRVLPISPTIIASNYIQIILKKMHSH